MKKIVYLMTALFMFLAIAQTSNAQEITKRDLKKQRKEQQDKVKDKAIKQARKEAERLTKEEGWGVFPGDKPMDKMLEDSWMKQYEMRFNDDGTESNAFIWAVGNGVAKTQSASTLQAMELAKLELAGQLQTRVAALTTSNIANAQLSGVDAETEMSIVTSAKNITAATLNNIMPVVKLVRTKIPKKGLKNNNGQQLKPGVSEVQVMLFYDVYQIDTQVRDAIKTELKEKMKDNETELKKLMDL